MDASLYALLHKTLVAQLTNSIVSTGRVDPYSAVLDQTMAKGYENADFSEVNDGND